MIPVILRMKYTFRRRRTISFCMGVALPLCSALAVAQNRSMDCTRDPRTHVKLAEGDQGSPTHLQLARKIAGGASVDLNVCDAELTIKGGKDDLLHVSVDFDNGMPKLPAADYLQAFDVTPQSVDLKLYLPKRPRAKVIIELPARTPVTQVNLVRGDLSFETDRISGDRGINVVFGHVDVFGNEDSYKTLQTTVLLGSYHDHRQRKKDAYGMFSETLSGTGAGSIAINVVKGSLDLKAWD